MANPLTFHNVTVYRDATLGDCTLGGVTQQYNHALLFVEPPPPDYTAPEGYAVLVLDKKPIMRQPRIRALPHGETRWCMFGGNFIWSCDSRFRQEVSEAPVPVHDRIEG